MSFPVERPDSAGLYHKPVHKDGPSRAVVNRPINHADERTRIVAWLREQAAAPNWPMWSDIITPLADAIESGEHLKEEP